MKTLTVDTFENYMDNAPVPANFDKVYEFLQEMIDDNFVVLADEITQNYIQTTPDDTNRFLTEMRLYSDYANDENMFIHYRKVIESIDEVFKYFELFFNDKSINIDDWENVTQEFSQQIYVNSNINNQFFEYYLTPANDIPDYIIRQIEKFKENTDFYTIYPDGENAKNSLKICPENNGYIVILQNEELNTKRLITNIDDLKNLLIRFFNGSISDFVN